MCNEESDIEAAFAVGATGVLTDYPTLLSNYLRKHPPPPPPMINNALSTDNEMYL